LALIHEINQTEDEAMKAREADLMKMAVECTAETGLEPNEAQKLLLGNLENESREAKVRSSRDSKL
jgi:hypothetical protein